MKRRTLLVISTIAAVVVLLCLALLVLRYVDIPGTEWDNFLDMRFLIEWELKFKAR
jgi:cell division protein FtsX